MSSSVYFKFKSSKEPTLISFDGTGISVFELKQEIISVSGLGDGADFDLSIYNEETNEEYVDDTTIVPRATSVIARRFPASRPGHGKAARYVSGKRPIAAKNSYRTESSHMKVATTSIRPPTNGAASMGEAQSEEEKIAAMFQAGAEQWEQQQQMLASQKPIHRGGFGKAKPMPVPDHEPPAGYICYRCHEKGHWIQVCPTNDDPNFESKPRIKRTTGIPRSFLKTVDKASMMQGDGSNEESKQPTGVMVNAEGEYVIAEPDKASWEQYQAKAKASAAEAGPTTDSDEAQRLGLNCPLDKRLFVDPVKTPCCQTVYCNECIENALVNNDLVCPNCSRAGVLLDDLTADEETIAKLIAYETDKAAAATSARSVAKSPTAGDGQSGEASTPAEAAGTKAKSEADSPPPVTHEARESSVEASGPKPDDASSTSSSTSKKRAAEDVLESRRIPTGPAAMREQPKEAEKPVPLFFPKDEGLNEDFVKQMNAMASGAASHQQFPMPGMVNFPFMNASNGDATAMGQGAYMNPMMGYSPDVLAQMMMMQQQQQQQGMWPTLAGAPVGPMAFPPPNGGFNGGTMNGVDTYGPNTWPQAGGWNDNGMAVMEQQQQLLQQQQNQGYYHQQQHQQQQQQQQQHQHQHQHQQQQQLQQQYQHQFNGTPMNGKVGAFPNQQRPSFNNAAQNEDDGAYFRKPVNPHRHQNRLKRARPSDYTEL